MARFSLINLIKGNQTGNLNEDLNKNGKNMKKPERAGESARRANRVIQTRTVWMMFLLGVASFAALFVKLYDLQINQHEDLLARASRQQTRSVVVDASRGSIAPIRQICAQAPH